MKTLIQWKTNDIPCFIPCELVWFYNCFRFSGILDLKRKGDSFLVLKRKKNRVSCRAEQVTSKTKYLCASN